TWLESSDGCNGRREVLDAKACLADISPTENTGPHDLLANIVLIYNKLIAKENSQVLAEINGDPLLVMGTYHKGKVCCFASDCSPH
ncbi:glutamine amidotransferase, partial [Salmonella enterica subsp. enterica serovar Virginia]|nr:glutamine amidotransferase [Salmonella enterica subsp. enterica serovar Virginia]